jgi:hypothetical protein
MDGDTPKLELMEPASPEALIPSYELWPWLTAAAVLFTLLLILLCILLKKRKPTAINLMALRKAAFDDAKATLESITPTTCRETAIITSLILRKYLSTAANDPALFETHEEFISRHDSLQALTTESRAAAEAAFTRLASLKYAEEIPADHPAEVITDARKLLETLHPGFAK